MRARAAVVLERDEDVVVDLRAGAPHVDLRVHAPREAEQHERLVDEVRAEVEQQAAAVLGVRRLAPALGDLPAGSARSATRSG